MCSRKCIGTPSVLQQYKDMIEETKVDLKDHLLNVEQMLQPNSVRRAQMAENDAVDLQQIEEERDSAQQCITICTVMSTRIEEAQQTQANVPPVTSSKVITSRALEDCKGTMGLTAAELERKRQIQDERLKGMPPKHAASRDEAENIENIQEEKNTINQCLRIVSETYRNTDQLRINTVDVVKIGANSQFVFVSTVGDLIKAGTIKMDPGSIGWMGQMDDVSLQQLSRDNPRATPASQLESRDELISEFQDRYGPGVKLRQHGSNP